MKKTILFLIISSVLFGQDLSFTNDTWRSESAVNKFRVSYNIGFNTPMHIYGEKSFKLNESFSFSVAAVLSSENDIGATFERSNFPLISTGRFYQGELEYQSDKFSVSLGRHLDDQDPIQQNTIWNKSRLTGDGITWSWKFLENWEFRNSIEFLPNEENSTGIIFDRILNYHSLSWAKGRFSISVGEIDLYTGINQSINFHQSNPFLPYLFHYIDGIEKTTPGYIGDNENIIVTLGVKFELLNKLFFQSRIYVDDIQIDAVDRARVADTYLWFNEFYYHPGDHFRSSIQFSMGNPAMAWHNGPFTSLTTYDFELLPHSLGEIYSLGLNMQYHKKFFETIIKGKVLKKAIVDPFEPNLYLWEVQNDLEKVNVYSMDIKAGFYIFNNLSLWAHYNYTSDDLPIYNLILQANF